jgi:ABC-type Mn2+/Zn2+ transport system permease subunit
MALALPQGSTLGVALTLCAGSLLGVNFSDSRHEGAFFGVALLGALLVMGACLLWEARQHARFATSQDAEAGGIYAVAAAGVMALAASRAVPELGMLDVLRGEILAVSDTLLLGLIVALLPVTLVLLWLRQAFVALLFDPDVSHAYCVSPVALSLLANVLICTTIAVGGLVAGPLSIFGFLILPPLAVLPFAGNMRFLYIGSSVLGLLAAFLGFYLSYLQDEWNIPVPAAQLLLLGCALVLGRAWAVLRQFLSGFRFKRGEGAGHE